MELPDRLQGDDRRKNLEGNIIFSLWAFFGNGDFVDPGADPVSMRKHITQLMMMKPVKPRLRQVGLAGTGQYGQG